MRRALDVTADVRFEHSGEEVRLVGRGRRLSLEIPTLRAAFALHRAGAARLFSQPNLRDLFAASDVPIDLRLAREWIGVVHPSGTTNLTARLLGIRGGTLRPFALARAIFTRILH